MCRAPHYQVCSFETDRRDLPLVEFAELKLDCTMIVISEHVAQFCIVSIVNPFAGLLTKPRSGFGLLKLTAIDYVIYCERKNGQFVSQGFRHEFTKPPTLHGTVLESRPGKLFELQPLNVLLSQKTSVAKEFRCTKGIQFIA